MSENNQVKDKTKIIYKMRIVGHYECSKCPECHYEFNTKKPIQTTMPYCSQCDKIVFDADQKFCCWCGLEFSETELSTIEKNKVEYNFNNKSSDNVREAIKEIQNKRPYKGSSEIPKNITRGIEILKSILNDMEKREK